MVNINLNHFVFADKEILEVTHFDTLNLFVGYGDALRVISTLNIS